MTYIATTIGMVLIVLVLLNVLQVSSPMNFLERKKDKERFKAFFIKRYGHQFECPEALEEAIEESWKRLEKY